MLDACGSYYSKISPIKPASVPTLRHMTFGTLIHLGNQRLLEWWDGIKSKIKGTEGPEGLKVHMASSQERKTSVAQTLVTRDENQDTWCMSSIKALSRFTRWLLIALWLLYSSFPCISHSLPSGEASREEEALWRRRPAASFWADPTAFWHYFFAPPFSTVFPV